MHKKKLSTYPYVKFSEIYNNFNSKVHKKNYHLITLLVIIHIPNGSWTHDLTLHLALTRGGDTIWAGVHWHYHLITLQWVQLCLKLCKIHAYVKLGQEDASKSMIQATPSCYRGKERQLPSISWLHFLSYATFKPLVLVFLIDFQQTLP